MESKPIKYCKGNDSITNVIIDYYDVGGIETIEIIKSKLTEQQFIGFLRGNVIKYMCRAGYKNGTTALSDYDKAAYYTNALVKEHL
jgi:hypothetical protein